MVTLWMTLELIFMKMSKKNTSESHPYFWQMLMLQMTSPRNWKIGFLLSRRLIHQLEVETAPYSKSIKIQKHPNHSTLFSNRR